MSIRFLHGRLKSQSDYRPRTHALWPAPMSTDPTLVKLPADHLVTVCGIEARRFRSGKEGCQVFQVDHPVDCRSCLGTLEEVAEPIG